MKAVPGGVGREGKPAPEGAVCPRRGQEGPERRMTWAAVLSKLLAKDWFKGVEQAQRDQRAGLGSTQGGLGPGVPWN